MSSNMFEGTAATLFALFGAHATGNPLNTVGVISGEELPAEAQSALTKSTETLGFGREACAFVVLNADGNSLGPDDVRLLIEGIDPVALVVADQVAALAVSAAYRLPLSVGVLNRVSGRNTAVFESFSAMLQDPEQKRVAWELLKLLK